MSSFISFADGSSQVDFNYEPLFVEGPQFKDNLFVVETITSYNEDTPVPSKRITKNPGNSNIGAEVTIAGEGLNFAQKTNIETLFKTGGEVKIYIDHRINPETFIGNLRPPRITRISTSDKYKYSFIIILTE